MRRLSSATGTDLSSVAERARALQGCATAQEAAQGFADLVYGAFRESFVLLRVFAAVPFASLPEPDRRLAEEKAAAARPPERVRDSTPVLALLGTRGERPEWNDRRESRKFRCIPLLSSRYVASLPMLSMQLEAMRFPVGLLDGSAGPTEALDGCSGLLHIPDAAAGRDPLGRMAVPAQDFVAAHGVESAFGLGAAHRAEPRLVTVFGFAREPLQRASIEGLEPAASSLSSALRVSFGAGRIWKRS